MGINVDRTIVRRSRLARRSPARPACCTRTFHQFNFTIGFFPGLKAFTAAVLGGIGNVPGAMLGGLFLGLIESIGPDLSSTGFGIPAPNQLKDVIAFTMLVLILVFRPQGLLGERVTGTAHDVERRASAPLQ